MLPSYVGALLWHHSPVPWLLVVFALIDVGVGFGGAEVVGYEATAATIEIDLSVRLADPAGPALVHLTVPGETLTRPLVQRAGREWGTVLEVRRANWQVVFEDVAAGELSASLSLTELGLDPALLGGGHGDTTSVERDTAATPMAWGWLAAAVLAGFGAIALVFAGRRKPRHLRRRRAFRRPASG
jgi:hypothetical protein